MASQKANGKQVKNAIVDAKCKLSAEECKDENCPVHGKPEESEKSADEAQPTEEDLDTLVEQQGQEASAAAATTVHKGDEKVADVEAAGKAIIAGAEEAPIVVVAEPDPELVEFVKSKGYSEEAAKKLVSEHGEEIRADFQKSKVGTPDEILADAVSVIRHMQHKDALVLKVIDQITKKQGNPRHVLLDAQTVLKRIQHHNDFTTALIDRIEAALS